IDGVGILVGLILQCAEVPPAFGPVGAQREGAGVVADGLVGVAGVPGGIGGLLQGLERVAGVLRECCRAETQRQNAKGGGAAGPERGHTKTFSLGRWFEPVGRLASPLRAMGLREGWGTPAARRQVIKAFWYCSGNDPAVFPVVIFCFPAEVFAGCISS